MGDMSKCKHGGFIGYCDQCDPDWESKLDAYDKKSMKTIAIQLNHTKDNELLEDKYALEEIGVEPIYYGLFPFSNDVTGTEDFSKYESVIPFGTVKLLILWQGGFLPPNTKIIYDEARFDQANYKNALSAHLLNHDAVYTTLDRVKDVPVNWPTFIKPTRDLKAFAGVIVEQDRTPGEEIFSQMQCTFLKDDEPVLMAPLKKIKREYRNFVVNGEIKKG
jgi:hypothetical protein